VYNGITVKTSYSNSALWSQGVIDPVFIEYYFQNKPIIFQNNIWKWVLVMVRLCFPWGRWKFK